MLKITKSNCFMELCLFEIPKYFFREEETKQTEIKSKIAFLIFVEMEISRTQYNLSN